MRVLVAFYSMTGHTRQVAKALSACLGCEVDEISDAKKRSGPLGFIRSGREAQKKECPPITVKKDPSRYDLVVVGTPVWGGTMSSPVRTFLNQYKNDIKKVAFFCTCEGPDVEKMFAEMESLCAKKPAGVLKVGVRELESGDYTRKVETFAGELQVVGLY